MGCPVNVSDLACTILTPFTEKAPVIAYRVVAAGELVDRGVFTPA
jgi:hypothetical protein